MTEEEERLQDLTDKYFTLLHAMQTGVRFLMEYDPSETSPKHLRVGVNSALADSGAVAELLIRKGVITREELYTELCNKLQKDVDSYTEKLEKLTGKKVTLT